jgi:hypothetical protein
MMMHGIVVSCVGGEVTSPYGAIIRDVRGERGEKGLLTSESLLKFGRADAERVWAEPVAPDAATPPYRTKDLWVCRAFGVGARKLEGERDVGRRRML